MESLEKICLISGATSGIGRAAALELARRGYRLGLIGRNPVRLQSTKEEISAINEKTKVDCFVADLSSHKEFARLAEELSSVYEYIDVLVNNAGAVYMKEILSEDGIEMTWALNHFGYFWLTEVVLELLQKTRQEKARIVNVSSAAHQRARIKNLDRVFDRKGMLGYFTYGESKLGNLWFTYELARRLKDENITVNALHPGLVATRFFSNNGLMGYPLKVLTGFFGLSAQEGAKTIVYLVDSPEVKDTTGGYFIREKMSPSSALSRDEQLARQFYLLSEAKTVELV